MVSNCIDIPPRQSSRRVAFEHTRDGAQPSNTLLFVGGLNDGFLTVPYIPSLAAAIPSIYSLVEVLLSSAYQGFGTSSLGQDVAEMADCVKYFRSLRPEGKIIIMGHSTGCQDVMYYLILEGQRPQVDGAILQAPVSDREAIQMFCWGEEYDVGVKLAQQWVDEGRGNDVLPTNISKPIMGARCTAIRWLSFTSPGPDHEGEDDLFSSDFDEARFQRSFGRAGKSGVPMSILYSGSDEYVPLFVDKCALVARMGKVFKEAGGKLDKRSGILEGASHTVKEEGEIRQNFIRRVVSFLEDIGCGTVG